MGGAGIDVGGLRAGGGVFGAGAGFRGGGCGLFIIDVSCRSVRGCRCHYNGEIAKGQLANGFGSSEPSSGALPSAISAEGVRPNSEHQER